MEVRIPYELVASQVQQALDVATHRLRGLREPPKNDGAPAEISFRIWSGTNTFRPAILAEILRDADSAIDRAWPGSDEAKRAGAMREAVLKAQRDAKRDPFLVPPVEWAAEKDLRPRVVSLVDAAVAAGHVGRDCWHPPSEGQWAWHVSRGWWGVERAGSYLGHHDGYLQHPRWGELEDVTGYESEDLAQEAIAGLSTDCGPATVRKGRRTRRLWEPR